VVSSVSAIASGVIVEARRSSRSGWLLIGLAGVIGETAGVSSGCVTVGISGG
jgi:hypothetical protein